MSSQYFDATNNGICDTWASSPTDAPFFQKLKRVIRFYRRYCIQRAKAIRKEEDNLRYDLDQKNIGLQTDPHSSQL